MSRSLFSLAVAASTALLAWTAAAAPGGDAPPPAPTGPSAFTLITNVPAVVFLAGPTRQRLGTTPLTTTLPAGVHELVVCNPSDLADCGQLWARVPASGPTAMEVRVLRPSRPYAQLFPRGLRGRLIDPFASGGLPPGARPSGANAPARPTPRPGQPSSPW
jgi:hypothetical protein